MTTDSLNHLGLTRIHLDLTRRGPTVHDGELALGDLGPNSDDGVFEDVPGLLLITERDGKP